MNNDTSSTRQNSALIRARTRFEATTVGMRLAISIARRFGLLDHLAGESPPTDEQDEQQRNLLSALRFVMDQARALDIRLDNSAQWQNDIRQLRNQNHNHPINRLHQVAGQTQDGNRIIDLLILAGLSDLHEGYAALYRLLHPKGQPYPTVTLALHWLEDEAGQDSALSAEPCLPTPGMQGLGKLYAIRDSIEEILLQSPLACLGVVRLEGEGPWHGRLLRPGPGAWEALNARPPQLSDARLIPGFRTVPGLENWIKQADVRQAVTALERGEPCMIAILGGNETMRATRIRALLGISGMAAIHTPIDIRQALNERIGSAVDSYCAAFMHQACPWLAMDGGDNHADGNEGRMQTPGFRWELPVIVSASAERSLPDLGLPMITLRVDALAAVSRRAMWGTLLPDLADHASLLAARYPIDPEDARNIASDLALRQRVQNRPLTFDDIGDCLRSRTLWHSRPGVQRVIPRASWHNLLLPDASISQLRQAVLRIHQQITVLDDWGFEQGRHDRRGLRMLFYGPPGTGKTLAAEAMAHALGIDLLVVDIASLVSKWIGETEKNLAGVFDLAESSRALLLFDEADALFGRRTEASDANDRHANLETAFLLQRLERYEGVAVLTTNLRTSLDAAFTRRFEFIVEFPEPDAQTRATLWKLHLPATAPLHHSIDLLELAEWYAISGAQIRNAALGAAFLAAADATLIQQRHFLLAIEREYDKAGKAHPGFPPEKPGRANSKPGDARTPGSSGSPHYTQAISPLVRNWPEPNGYVPNHKNQ